MKPLVSIITPCYNCEQFIADTINSVLNQTYKNFEMIIVDDISTDNSVSVVQKFAAKDKRIKLIQLPNKGGASEARNIAIKKAQGKYIAFLDADDLWKKDKLKLQVAFMERNKIDFSYTDYEYIDENGKKKNIYRKCPNKISYYSMLFGDSVGCLTVMYNASKVGLVQIPKLNKRNDYALWCLILKKIRNGCKLNLILSEYRISNEKKSLSSGNKIYLLKYHYQLHREINGFNPIMALFLLTTNVINYLFNIKIRDRSLKQNEN